MKRMASLIGGLLLSSHVLASDVFYQQFFSPTLRHHYPYSVYLPDGYDADASTPYPVVYLLHGSFGNERDWVSRGNLPQVADRLIAAGHLPPTVFVMPGSRSWWVDGYNEPARSAFFDDLLPHIESAYNVGSERQLRGVAGLSAGGYGALNFALERPDMFAAAAALSPASYVPEPPANSSARRHPAFLNEQGEFDRERWKALNYTAHLEDYRLNVTPRPTGTREMYPVPLYISAGRSDVYDAEFHARLLRQTMEKIQPSDVRLDLYPGGHTWRVWRASLPAALNFMFQHIEPPATSSSE
ncbi:esterase family protein [Halomonas zhaodongensis]|uniref:Esterase family protein n=2 Tax=Vreelandella zhaodongensis TaxID=1176240 RepID=A0ABX2SUT1_VREZH|nr:esterase family protein [Halomonas zhaodongensis]